VTPPLALSTLVAELVGETAEGVREAGVAAARRRAELAEGLGRPPTDEDVDGALASLFPPLERAPTDLLARVLDDEALDEYVSRWRPGDSAVRAGEPYLHPEFDSEVAEFPPIERELGVSVLETVERGDGAARLTEKSVALVRRAIRDRLVAEQRTAAGAFAGGVPTPVVESATVEVRAAFAGGEDGLEATLLDAREETAHPESVGGVTASLRFPSLPAGVDDPANADPGTTGEDRPNRGRERDGDRRRRR
jgi:hypothetical protein